MNKISKPPPKKSNPMARVVTHLVPQVIPNKKKQPAKHKPDPSRDWAFFYGRVA